MKHSSDLLQFFRKLEHYVSKVDHSLNYCSKSLERWICFIFGTSFLYRYSSWKKKSEVVGVSPHPLFKYCTKVALARWQRTSKIYQNCAMYCSWPDTPTLFEGIASSRWFTCNSPKKVSCKPDLVTVFSPICKEGLSVFYISLLTPLSWKQEDF